MTSPAALPLDASIDRDQIRHFLRTLDPDAKWFTVQTFTDRENKPSPDPFAKVFNVNRFTKVVLDAYAQGAGVWITVNDTAGNGRKASAVTRIRDVWQEDDDGYEGDFPLEPSLIVETSPGRYHRHWFVDGDWPADAQGRRDFDGVMATMVTTYGSDKGAKDISRVLRVPGFLHRKNPDAPHMVRIVGGNGQRYTRGQILAAFPPLAKTSARQGNGNGHADTGYSEAYAELVRQVLTGENYHSALTSLAWRQVVAGMPGGQAVEHLRGVMLSTPEDQRDERWHGRFAEIPRLVSSAQEKQAEVSGELRPPEFSDDALADAFAEQYGDCLRYVARFDAWYRYDGTRWVEEERPGIFEAARSICREAAKRCKKSKEKKSIASAKTVAAVERLARGDPRHAARPEQWDADPCLLNTPSGVIDLRTGKKRKHRPEDYMIKMAAIAPGGDCPRWRQFLGEITNGDTALQQFLQRLAGYSLTGDVSEEALFFLYGTGGNGKGVFMDTTARIMGDYCRNAPFDMFTVSHAERHPTELAMLKDVRMVNSTEIKDGRRWDETKLKALTGGDPIVARHMRQDFFEFRPQFKLVIAGNHKPRLSSVDEAIRRRFHLVPFTVTIGPDKRDDGLKKTLEGEWPGILRWMIDGCINWQEFGLAPPEAVTNATTAYLEAEDVVSNWIADCCQVDRSIEDTTKRLYESYKAWAEQAGERPLSKGKLGDALEDRGYKRIRTENERRHIGVRVKA